MPSALRAAAPSKSSQVPATPIGRERHLHAACSHTALRRRRTPPAFSALNSSTSCSNSSSSVCQGEGHQPSPVLRVASLTLPACAALALAFPDASQAIAAEPSNALSLPTWAIHVSCVFPFKLSHTHVLGHSLEPLVKRLQCHSVSKFWPFAFNIACFTH
eukprot:508069-Pelagomonas_calceolata.AAC.3